ncbi:hypothetical protein V2J09_015207 [Rumex salicifolius]
MALWREALGLDWVDNSLGSSKKVIDVISANTNDLGFLSLGSFKKSKLSASRTIIGNGSSDIMLTDVIRESSDVKKEDEANEQNQLAGCDDEGNCDSPEIQVRMLSREKLRKEHAAGLKIEGYILEEAATKQSHSIEAAATGNCKDIDDVLAASVAVNSTIKNAKGLEKHAYYVATDKLNFESMDRFKSLNSSCCTVLSQQKNIASRQANEKQNSKLAKNLRISKTQATNDIDISH